MSFGFSVGDFILLTQLASNVVQGARQACGAHDELTREVTSLHIVLRQLEREVAKPQSILNSDDDDRKLELKTLAEHCEKSLKVLSNILEKYNGLSEEKRKITKFWKKVQFSNGEMQDLSKIRLELSTHTNVITLFLNLLSIGSLGKVEEQMTSHGEELKAMRRSVNWVTASLQATSGREGSILSDYIDDDKTFWRELRRGLVREGYTSRVLRKHKGILTDYVKELGDRGVLDELSEEKEDNAVNGASGVSPEDPNNDEISLGASAKEDEEPTPNHASVETPTTATDENDVSALRYDTLETPTITALNETEEVLPSPPSLVLEGTPEENTPGQEEAEEMKTLNSTLPELKSGREDIPKIQENIRASEDKSERDALRRRKTRARQEMREKRGQGDLRDEASEVRQEKVELWQEELRQEELRQKIFWEEEMMAREELRRGEPESEELAQDHQKEERGRRDAPDTVEPGKPTSPAPTEIPSSRTQLPRPVFVPTPNGSWQRVYGYFDEDKSQSSPGQYKIWPHSHNKPVTVEGVGIEYFPSIEYPLHEEDDGGFWEPPWAKISLDFVVDHLEGLYDDPLDERGDVFHNGDIFVVPRSGDPSYVSFTSPKFAYNLGGTRIPVTGRHGHLAVQSPNLAFIAPSPPKSSLPQVPVRTKPYLSYNQATFASDIAERYARAYISVALGKSLSAPPPSYLLRNRATHSDIRRYFLPAKSSIELWNPPEEPIMILDSVFDSFSLGHWIYNWTIFCYGASTPIAAMAAELWILCIQWPASVKTLEVNTPSIRNEDTREMLEDFIESGERLMDKLKALMSACEGSMMQQTKIVRHGDTKVFKLGNEAGLAFVDTIFHPEEQLEATERWMTSVRLWSFRFDANCSPILSNLRYHAKG